MPQMKIRSYNARRAKIFGKSYTWTDRLILMRSDPHTHTEIQFGEANNFISFSTTTRDGNKAARFKQINYSHVRERWDTIIVNVTPEEESIAFERAKALEGTPYDLFGLLSKATPFKIIKPHRINMWCSEAVTHVVIAAVPGFDQWLDAIPMPLELTPFELDTLARLYFQDKQGT